MLGGSLLRAGMTALQNLGLPGGGTYRNTTTPNRLPPVLQPAILFSQFDTVGMKCRRIIHKWKRKSLTLML